jgi:gluconokinase
MRAGIALDDGDRWPWLDRIADWMRRQSEQQRQGVVACSALRRSYRDRLRVGADVRFVYLRVPPIELERRLRQRMHFMPVSLLDSQLGILEEPEADEDALTLSGSGSTGEQLQQVRHWIDR